MSITQQIEALAACLCEELESPTCFCGVFAGADPYDAMGECEGDNCGQAWVRLLAVYPSGGVGVPNTSLNNCGAGLSYDIEIGVLRCAPIQEEAYTEAEMLEFAQKQYSDMLAMRRAVACCDALEEYIMAAYAPVGPDGGVIGGVWNLTLGDY